MKNHHCKSRPIVFSLCLILQPAIVQNASIDAEAEETRYTPAIELQQKRPVRSGKSKRKSERPASESKDGSHPVTTPSLDKVISNNRALVNEVGDADPSGAKSAGAKIDENLLRAHVKFLADDLLEGRSPGGRGGLLAAKYIAAQFESLGLEPAAANRGYFQQVHMIGTRPDAANKLVVKSGTEASESKVEFKMGDEFTAGTDLEQNEVSITGEVVFVGYGILSPENKWDDYKGLDVRDKVLMIMVNDPPPPAADPGLFGGRGLTYYGRWTYKYEEAARRGAAGVILIHTNESAGYGWSVVRNSWSGDRFGLLPDSKTPTLKMKSWVTDEVARKIVQMSGQNLDQLRQSAETREFRPVVLNARVETTLRFQAQRMSSPNVVGIFRGNDPVLKNEYIVYSAHWDHLGIRQDQPGDNIYNGAVDNATGIAGILGIARAFSALDVKPRRSILFIATTAEEQGLLGAEYYIRYPLVPLAQTKANINLDSMNVLGQTTDMTPLGADRSTLGIIVEEVAKENNLTISPDAHPEQGYFLPLGSLPVCEGGYPGSQFRIGEEICRTFR